MGRILIISLLIISSCAPVYVPNIRNSPMFTDGGEFQGAVQVGNGLDVQAALSVSKHIGFMGGYSFADREKFTSITGASRYRQD